VTTETVPRAQIHRWRWRSLAPRIEDWLLVGVVALAAPLLGSSKGSLALDAHGPVDGLIRLGAVMLALAAIAVKPRDPQGATGKSIFESGAIGPLSRGVLLIAITGAAALGSAAQAVAYTLIVTGIVMVIVIRWRVPPQPAQVRRALITPLVLVAGGIFWALIDALTGSAPGGAFLAMPGLLFFVAFSAVFYAMLLYAPRQMVDREGSSFEWILRYGLFAAGVLGGLGWARLIGV